MKIILLRHGQSVWNLENRFTGWKDVTLTDEGKKEALFAAKLYLRKKCPLFRRYLFESFISSVGNKGVFFNIVLNLNSVNVLWFFPKLTCL